MNQQLIKFPTQIMVAALKHCLGEKNKKHAKRREWIKSPESTDYGGCQATVKKVSVISNWKVTDLENIINFQNLWPKSTWILM